jgi:hypothetical protein
MSHQYQRSRTTTPSTALQPHEDRRADRLIGHRRQIASACVLALLCVPAASHASGWSLPRLLVSVPSGVHAEGLELARDSAGDAVAVWVDFDGPSGGSVEASTRRQGGAWSAPVRLGHGDFSVSNPQVAMDSLGRATVVWAQTSYDPRRRGEPRTVRILVKARSYSVARGWGASVALVARHELLAGEAGIPEPHIAVHREEVIAAFAIRERRAKPSGGREDVLLFTGDARGWGSPIVVGHTTENTEMRLAVDGRGERILAWSGNPEGSGWVETQVVTRSGRTSGPAQIVSTKSGAADELSLAVNSRGGAVLTWTQELADGDGRGPDEATTRPAGGRFDKRPVILVHKAYAALTAIGADGVATVQFNRVMRKSDGEEVGAGLEAATHTPKGGWNKPTLVARGVFLLALSSGPDGELIGLWEGGVPGPPFNGEPREIGVIDASIEPAQGSWQPPQTISPPNTSEDDAALGVAANGQATAIWVRRPNEHTETIETGDYQAEPLG